MDDWKQKHKIKLTYADTAVFIFNSRCSSHMLTRLPNNTKCTLVAAMCCYDQILIDKFYLKYTVQCRICLQMKIIKNNFADLQNDSFLFPQLVFFVIECTERTVNKKKIKLILLISGSVYFILLYEKILPKIPQKPIYIIRSS